MKKFLSIILTVLSLGPTFGQTDINGNPIFNSVSTNEKIIDDFLLISNYYTLQNNIENRNSSVFISENPTLDQIENAAIDLSSDFFILTKESRMVAMVILQNSPKREFMTIVFKSNLQSNFPCKLSGEITENRANEIIKANYDTAAIIENNTLKFNGKEFRIISNLELEEAILALIKKEKLNKRKPSDIFMPSKNEVKNYIISETIEGGVLDFFTEIKGHEYDGVQIKPGLFTSKHSISLYKWGRACFDLGVNTIDDAYEIYAEYKTESVSVRDKDYIRMGFYKEWEK